jgi:hypothetical protein
MSIKKKKKKKIKKILIKKIKNFFKITYGISLEYNILKILNNWLIACY